MKVLFVIPNVKRSGNYYVEPLGTMYLASVARRAGNTCSATRANWPDLSDALSRFSPDVLAFSAMTGSHNFYLELARQAKVSQPHSFIVFGGPHPTYFPDMIEENGVDAVCRGEGEEAFEEFLDCLHSGRDFTKVRNFWVKRDGRIHKNPVRPAIRDLDTVPFPDRAIVSLLYKLSARFVITSRGCPYDCGYCFNHAFRKLYAKVPGKVVRYRTVDNVTEELRAIVRDYPATKMITFIDDTLNINRVRLKEFCKRYRDEIGLPFSCLCRIDLVTEEMAQVLADAGCVLISVGIESGNDRIRQEVMKRNMSQETIVRGCQMIRNAGIKIRTYNILGVPPGNFEDDLETVELNIRCRPNFSSAFLFTPYPMTEMGEKARAEGYWRDERYSSFFETFAWDRPGEESRLRLKDRAEIETLRPLFMLAVQWPILYRPIKWLCRLAGRCGSVERILRAIGRWVHRPVLFMYYLCIKRLA